VLLKQLLNFKCICSSIFSSNFKKWN